MAAPDHVYVDPVSGDDSSGDGSVGTPWKTTQKAMDSVSGSSGNQINIKDSGADTLSTDLTWTSYSPTNSFTNPLILSGYTSAANDGGIFEIDGNSAASKLFSDSSKPDYVWVFDGKVHGCTSQGIKTGSHWGAVGVELYNNGSSWQLHFSNDCHAIGCYLHTLGANAEAIVSSNRCHMFFNRIAGVQSTASYAVRIDSNAVFAFNLIDKCPTDGVLINDENSQIFNNTIVGTSTSGDYGLTWGGTSRDFTNIFNNIFVDWGTGGSGGAWNLISGNVVHLLAGNVLHNCDTEVEAGVIVKQVEQGSIDPIFRNSAGGDFTPLNSMPKAWMDNHGGSTYEEWTAMVPGAVTRKMAQGSACKSNLVG